MNFSELSRLILAGCLLFLAPAVFAAPRIESQTHRRCDRLSAPIRARRRVSLAARNSLRGGDSAYRANAALELASNLVYLPVALKGP